VKLAACLTEVTTVWAATGGAVLMSVTGGTLGVAAQRGLDLPRDVVIKLDPASALFRCASRGKHEVISDFPGEVLPGISAKSAICIAIKSGEATRGVLILWSSEPDAFTQDDVGALSLFAYYLATLIEFDELGDRLGENLVTDPLTGLHNRRQFETRLDQELLRAKRYTLNLSLIVFDVDQLANYNNACGQMLGNLALSDIASILTKGTREVDFVSRIGGDEFAVILPETNRLGALRLADRLRSEVSSYPFPVPEDGSTISLTVSGGISNFPAATSPENDLLATAYVALEQAKQERTDSVKLWDAKTQ
jgi:diguanylate cyclase (GGDEF)-like protein